MIDWLEYKSSKGQTYKTDKSTMQMVNALWEMANKNVNTAREIVNYSIVNNYSGLFEPKAKKQEPELIGPKPRFKDPIIF